MATAPKLIILTLVGIVVFASACESNDSSDQAAQSFSEFLNAAEMAADSAMLTLNDFPPGWTSSESSESEDSDFDVELSNECEVLNADFSPGQVYSADSDDFTGPDGQEVSSDGVVFTSRGAAQNIIDTFSEALGRCKAELTRAFEKGFVDAFNEASAQAAPAPEINVTFAELSFEDLGESSSAFRVMIEVPIAGLDRVIDSIFILQGKMTGSLTYAFSGESNIDEELELARLFADKLRTAEATLPD